MLEVIYRHAAADGRGDHVDALVHALHADGLRAQYLARGFFKEQLEGQGLGAGVVARVGAAVRVDLLVLHAAGLQLPLVVAHHRGGMVEHLDDRRAQRVAVLATAAPGDVVCGDAPLPVGRARQRDARGSPEMKSVTSMASPTAKILPGRWCAFALSTAMPPVVPIFKPRRHGQLGFGLHADAQHREVRRDFLAALQHGGDAAIRFPDGGRCRRRGAAPRRVRQAGFSSAAISASSGPMMWSASSTMSTSRPRCARFSAISMPMYPAPMTTARLAPPCAASVMRCMSGMFRNV